MKVKNVWHCSSCGQKHAKWTGQCSACSEWNTIHEEIEIADRRTALFAPKKASKPMRLDEIAEVQVNRMASDLVEFDRAVGGGLVPGSLILIGGEPGIGKSTLSLQLANSLAKHHKHVLYICGEESLEQTSLRAKRLGTTSQELFFVHETECAHILKLVEEVRPHILIIDSIQIVYKSELASAPGSVSQVRETAATFMHLAKSQDIATILIGHVTKSGEIAGPKVLEHLVDTVLYFEGDKQQNFRLLRVMKNRFGPTDEIAVFQMQANGLQEVPNPSQMFLEERMRGASGSSIVPMLEGSRPILIEIQALVTETFFPSASRRSTGLDSNRVALLLAVLEKRAKLQLHKCDVFVSVAGGMHIAEPAADLGVLLSIASSFCNKNFQKETLVVGEVGLGGEIRAVSRIESRVKEGIQMGFARCIVPQRNAKGISSEVAKKIEIIGIEWVDQAIDELVR